MHKNRSGQDVSINPNPVATLFGHTKSVNALAFLHDGRLASASSDKSIKLWNLSTGNCEATLLGHEYNVKCLTVLLDGRLASGTGKPYDLEEGDQTIRIWNVSSESCEATLKSRRASKVIALAALPNRLLASAYEYYYIRIWNVSTGNCEAKLHVEPEQEKLSDGTWGPRPNSIQILSLVALPDGRFACGSNDNLIRLWGKHSGYLFGSSWSCQITLSGHTSWVHALAVLHDGRLASGSGVRESRRAHGNHDNIDPFIEIKLWNLSTGICVSTIKKEGNAVGYNAVGQLEALTELSSGHLVSSVGYGGNTLQLWNVRTGQCEASLEGGVEPLAALPNRQLASRSGDDRTIIKIWDMSLRPVLEQKAIATPRATAQPTKLKSDNAVREKVPLFVAPKPSVNDPFSEFDDFFSSGSSSQTTVKASTDWTMSDFATVVPPQPPEPIIPAFSDLRISSALTTIPWHALLIQRELGRGGFGVVCEALWQGTRVAIKQLIGQLTPALLNEFRSETEVHARLRHTNIIALYGVCIEPMKYALVMEFMASGSLFDVLKNPAELPWSLRLNLALDMVSGLLYLHTQQIIHRDLKSLNILVDEHMRAKIADFGLAKIKLSTASMTKGAGGTPHWMAPELFDDTVNSKATDIYAIGIILWEIAARKLPYEGKNASQIMRTVEKGNREPIPAGTPSSFGMLIGRCWAQRAEDRPTIEVVTRNIQEMQTASPSNNASSSVKASLDSGYIVFSRR